jgi:CubicO group peptidase (beta-lactamase class C family)
MRARFLPTLLCVSALAAALAGCETKTFGGTDYAATIAEGRAAVAEAMAESGATAVSVAFVEGDRVVWSEAFGEQDPESGLAASTASLFGICSVSKMLTTTATMILVDQGAVDLDEPLTTYLPDLSMPLDERYRSITPRMLLNHTSGLPGNDMRGVLTVEPFPGYAAQMLESLRYQRLKHAPGDQAAYNNDGFSMVANLIQARSGQTFPDFVRDNILTPLGMTSSRYATVPLADGVYARPFSGATALPVYVLNGYSTGGLYSPPEEMARLAMMLMNGGEYGGQRILSEGAIAAMAEDQRAGTFNPVADEEYRFGLGWDTIRQPGLAAVGFTAWQKTGDLGGYFGANLAVIPDERLAVVVTGASNHWKSGHAVMVSERILLRALVDRGRLAAMPAALPTTDLATQAVPPADLETYAGHYASANGVYRVSFGAGDTLTVEEYGDAWEPMYQGLALRSDGWYAADGDPVAAVQTLTSEGRVYLATRFPGGAGHYALTSLFAERLDDAPALSTEWQPRLAEVWLPVNQDPPTFLGGGDPSTRFQTIDGLPGYARASNLLRDTSPASADRLDGTFLRLPDMTRSLVEVGGEDRGGEEWLRQGSFLHRPMSALPVLDAGATTLSFDADAPTEWRQLPAAGTVSVTGAAYWFVYDASLAQLASGTTSGSATFSGAGANFLAVMGVAGETVAVDLQ